MDRMTIDELLEWLDKKRDGANSIEERRELESNHSGVCMARGFAFAYHEVMRHITKHRPALEAGMRGRLRFRISERTDKDPVKLFLSPQSEGYEEHRLSYHIAEKSARFVANKLSRMSNLTAEFVEE